MLSGTGLERALQRLLQRGGAVGGSSAGASLLCAPSGSCETSHAAAAAACFGWGRLEPQVLSAPTSMRSWRGWILSQALMPISPGYVVWDLGLGAAVLTHLLKRERQDRLAVARRNFQGLGVSVPLPILRPWSAASRAFGVWALMRRPASCGAHRGSTLPAGSSSSNVPDSVLWPGGCVGMQGTAGRGPLCCCCATLMESASEPCCSRASVALSRTDWLSC